MLSVLVITKHEKLICSVYTFTTITFINVIISFIFAYSFSEKSLIILVLPYLTYDFSYGFMVYCKANADFMKKSSETKINFKIILIPFITVALTSIAAFPISKLLKLILKTALRLLLHTSEVETYSDLQGEDVTEPSEFTEPLPIEQSNIARYIFIALLVAMAIFFIYYLRYEILDFFRNIVKNLKTKIKHLSKTEEIIRHEEYTDIISQVSPIATPISVIKAPKRTWNKRYKSYKKSDWSEQKLLYGFGLAQNGLIICGIDISDCDTVNDIELKLPDELVSVWRSAANAYMDLKYNGAMATAIAKKYLDELLYTISSKI